MNKNIPFVSLCQEFEKISKTKKRLEIQHILSQFLIHSIHTHPESLIPILYLCTATQPNNKELGLGESTIIKVVSDATSKKIKTIREEMRKTGDLGLVAMKYRVSQLFVPTKRLSVENVFEELIFISEESGPRAMNQKSNRMLKLISLSSDIETKYLIRMFEGKMKIGLALKTVLISLAFATQLEKLKAGANGCECKKTQTDEISEEKKEVQDENFSELADESSNSDSHSDNLLGCSESLKKAYNCTPLFEVLVPLLLKYGSEQIHLKVHISPGIPVMPMLAQPAKNLTTAFKKVEKTPFTCEYKYDGERAQIHRIIQNEKQIETIKIFSRNSEDLTPKYPDIIKFIKTLQPKDSYILDTEIVAYNRNTNKILPFQILSTRKRKDVITPEVNVCVFAFDILYYNGSLLGKELSERRKILFENFKEIDGHFKFVTFKDVYPVVNNDLELSDTPLNSINSTTESCNKDKILTHMEDIDIFFNEAINVGCEGLMIKILEGETYTPSKRSNTWIKLKKDYLEGMADTLDLTVIGAYYGKGKRTGSYGGFLLAVYDDKNDLYEAVCKIGTGFDDEMLVSVYEEMKDCVVHKPFGCVYKEGVKPDVWIKPGIVWEVKAAGFTTSSIYSAGCGRTGERGISLRFPRFIRKREDKKSEESTKSSEILSMYNDSIRE